MKWLHNESERKHYREGYVCGFLLLVPENIHSCFCSHRKKECVSLMNGLLFCGQISSTLDLVSFFLRCSLPWLQPIQNTCKCFKEQDKQLCLTEKKPKKTTDLLTFRENITLCKKPSFSWELVSKQGTTFHRN